MRLSSGKFKYLDRVKTLLPEGAIPSFRIMDTLGQEQEIAGRFILRSALRNESQKDQLQSGKSLSITGIDSWQKLLNSWEAVQKQPQLEEVILQEEIQWNTHITLIYEKDFFFAELKMKGSPSQFIYWTPLGQSLSPLTKKLKEFLDLILSVLKEETFWLMELGLRAETLFLFQIHPVHQELISHIFSSELAPQIISSRLRFSKSQGLFNLMKTEWEARKFRSRMKNQNFQPSAVFLNWEFLFHYFRLFCMIHQLKPDAQSFGRFLSDSYKNHWLSSLVKKHLELASYFRKNETFELMNLGFEGQHQIFIGKGIIGGVVGEEILVCDEISLETIYQSRRPKAILSKEVGLLSHPVLASVENGIHLVLGLKELPQKGERIYLDFERKVLTVE